MFNWRLKATNAIYLEDSNGQEGRPFKSRFLQAGLVKYDFGVCLLKKESIDKFVNTFIECPVIINHKDNIAVDDVVGTIQKIWFSSDDGWFWCSGVITNDTAIELIEKGYNVSCQYRITEYSDNDEGKLHNANPYDKEILGGVFEHLAIVENPRYEDAFIAVNAYIAINFDENKHPRDDEGKFTDGNEVNQNFEQEIDETIKKAKSNDNSNSIVTIGNVDKKLIDEAKKQGLDLTGYKHNIDVYGIKHSFKNHSDKEKENNRGQIPITDEDIKKAKEYVYSYDNSSFGEKNDQGRDIIKLWKQMPDGYVLYIEEVRTGKHTLTLNSMRKYKNKIGASNTLAGVTRHVWKNTDTNSITDNKSNFNPNAKINIATNDYTKVFDWIKNTKGEFMDTETKNVFSQLLEALKARNEAEEDKEKEKEKDKEADPATNEDVDKRKLIDEVGGILKGKVDEELWRTIIGKIEKVAYDKSEAGTADNSKAKNENIDKRDIIRQIIAIAGKHEDNEDVRTIAKLAETLAYDKSEAGTADNSKCKNAEEEKLYEELKEKVEKEAENKKAKNALDEAVNLIYSAVAPEPKSTYVSQAEGLALGKQIYG